MPINDSLKLMCLSRCSNAGTQIIPASSLLAILAPSRIYAHWLLSRRTVMQAHERQSACHLDRLTHPFFLDLPATRCSSDQQALPAALALWQTGLPRLERLGQLRHSRRQLFLRIASGVLPEITFRAVVCRVRDSDPFTPNPHKKSDRSRFLNWL